MTLKVPDDLHEAMRRHPEIRWSEVARRAFKMELDRLDIYDRLLANSRVTQKDVLEIGREINKAVSRKVGRRVRELRKE